MKGIVWMCGKKKVVCQVVTGGEEFGRTNFYQSNQKKGMGCLTSEVGGKGGRVR